MSPLLNPRHEAFAFALAYGSTPAEAYLEAGFNPKNRKARAQPLADDPIIVNRVNELRQEDSSADPFFARNRNAQPFTIIPQTADELAQYVWQIIKGTRHVTPTQWQAIRFLGRLKRWDRSGPHLRKPGPDADLTWANRESLALLDAVQIAREAQLHGTGIAQDDPAAADGDSECDQAEFEPPALFDPDAPIPHYPDYIPTEEDLTEEELTEEDLADLSTHEFLNRLEADIAKKEAAVLPAQNPPSKEVRKTAESGPQDTVAEPENPHSSTNVDSNPHAQLPENQPLNPKNPQMWIKKEKSTSRPRRPKTPAKKSQPLCPSAAKKQPPPIPFPPLTHLLQINLCVLCPFAPLRLKTQTPPILSPPLSRIPFPPSTINSQPSTPSPLLSPRFQSPSQPSTTPKAMSSPSRRTAPSMCTASSPASVPMTHASPCGAASTAYPIPTPEQFAAYTHPWPMVKAV